MTRKNRSLLRRSAARNDGVFIIAMTQKKCDGIAVTRGKIHKPERKGVFLPLPISVFLKEQKVQQSVS